MSILERCPSYKESNKRSKERQGPTLGVRLIKVSVKRESTVCYSPLVRSKKRGLFCGKKGLKASFN